MSAALENLTKRFGMLDGSIRVTVRAAHGTPVQYLTLTVLYLPKEIGGTVVLDPIQCNTNNIWMRRTYERKLRQSIQRTAGRTVRVVPGSNMRALNRFQVMEN